MITNNYSDANFRAKFICKTPVQKMNPKTHSYGHALASFVEFDSCNSKDFKALLKAKDQWHSSLCYSHIVENAGIILSGAFSNKNHRLYILTSQKDNYDKLNAKRILGLAYMDSLDEKTGELKYFQTRPDLMHGNPLRQYKHVGKSMLKTIKQIADKNFRLISSSLGAKFYDHEGLKLTDENLLEYTYIKE